MHRIVYLSFATDDFQHEKDIDSILAKARSFNIEKGITGMLIYKDKSFLQLLEGNEEDIQDLYKKIKNDPL